MEGMKYFLICTNFENRTEFAGFWADDEEHALEQLDLCCDEYNPSQYVTHIFVSDTEIVNTASQKLLDTQERLRFITNLKVGDEVSWDDPDGGLASGIYKIISIETDDGNISYENDIVNLSNGFSDAQAFVREIY